MRMLRRDLLLVAVGIFWLVTAVSACSVDASKGQGDNKVAPVATVKSHSKNETTPQAATDSQGGSKTDAAPEIVFTERLYDAGTVQAGKELTHTFLVKNVGKGDLLIKQVKPG